MLAIRSSIKHYRIKAAQDRGTGMLRIVCRRCSFELYRGEAVVSVSEAIKKRAINLRCPRCLRRLDVEDFEVLVKPAGR